MKRKSGRLERKNDWLANGRVSEGEQLEEFEFTIQKTPLTRTGSHKALIKRACILLAFLAAQKYFLSNFAIYVLLVRCLILPTKLRLVIIKEIQC